MSLILRPARGASVIAPVARALNLNCSDVERIAPCPATLPVARQALDDERAWCVRVTGAYRFPDGVDFLLAAGESISRHSPKVHGWFVIGVFASIAIILKMFMVQ
jgi:hypothetical protein